ncbi:hypothetical protein D3C85_937860 [compost metagenome]
MRVRALHVVFDEAVHDLHGVRVHLIQEGCLLIAFLVVQNQRLIQAELRWYSAFRVNPVDRAFDFTAGEAAAAFGLDIISTVQLNNVAIRILDEVVALDEVGVFQTHFVAREETEILRRRIFHEIVLLDVDLAGERNHAVAHFRVLGIVLRLQHLRTILRIVSDDNFKRIEHAHRAERLQFQILTDEVVEHARINNAASATFGNAKFTDKITNRFWC